MKTDQDHNENCGRGERMAGAPVALGKLSCDQWLLGVAAESSDLQPGSGGGGKHWTCLGDTISS